MKKLLIAALVASAATSAFAAASANQSIPLKDGSTVHVFEDGRMAMEDKYGRATMMEDGRVMETSDGKLLVMRGNEVARLYAQLLLERQG